MTYLEIKWIILQIEVGILENFLLPSKSFKTRFLTLCHVSKPQPFSYYKQFLMYKLFNYNFSFLVPSKFSSIDRWMDTTFSTLLLSLISKSNCYSKMIHLNKRDLDSHFVGKFLNVAWFVKLLTLEPIR